MNHTELQEALAGRRFSFYPPLLGVEHNEWTMREATWSELLVQNAATEETLWLPRGYVSELSRVREPVIIVGLTRELEYRAGAVRPTLNRVLTMKEVPGPPPESLPPLPPAPSVMTLSTSEKRIGVAVLLWLGAAVMLCAVVVGVFRYARSTQALRYRTVTHASLGLSSSSDYGDVVRLLGEPASMEARQADGELPLRILRYPARQLNIVLSGREKNQMRYLGAVDPAGKVVDSVQLPGGADSSALLRNLAMR
jgi:hypothetical protein